MLGFTIKGLVCAVLAAICWGGVYAINDVILGKISPLKLMLLGGVLDILIIVPILMMRGEKLFKVSAAELGVLPIILAALLIAFAANFFILSSIQYIGATNAAIAEITYPLFTALILFMFLGKQLDSRFVIGGILVFVGMCIIIARDSAEVATVKEQAILSNEPSTLKVEFMLPKIPVKAVESEPQVKYGNV